MDMSDVLKVVGLCLAMVSVGTAMKMTYKDCGSVGATVENLDLSPCDTDPCVIHHRMNYTAKITFVANEDVVAPTRKLAAIMGPVSIPFPLNPDACSTGLQCPVKKGERRVQVTSMYVKPSYPKVRLAGKFSLLDEEKRKIFCVVIPLKISD